MRGPDEPRTSSPITEEMFAAQRTLAWNRKQARVRAERAKRQADAKRRRTFTSSSDLEKKKRKIARASRKANR